MPVRIGQPAAPLPRLRSEEHTSELQSQSNLVCRLLLEKKKHTTIRACSRRGYRASDAEPDIGCAGIRPHDSEGTTGCVVLHGRDTRWSYRDNRVTSSST